MFDFSEQGATLIIVEPLPLRGQLGELHIGAFRVGVAVEVRFGDTTVSRVRDTAHDQSSHHNCNSHRHYSIRSTQSAGSFIYFRFTRVSRVRILVSNCYTRIIRLRTDRLHPDRHRYTW